MDVKLVSKNNVGAIATLLLIILLSHARFFDFLVDTALGRAILILFILGISYINKISKKVEGKKVEDKKVEDKKVEDKKVQEKKVESKAIEGFNITEREHVMLKGKRSNEAIVYSNSRNSDDDVEPSNKSIFTDNYSPV